MWWGGGGGGGVGVMRGGSVKGGHVSGWCGGVM